MNSNILNWAFAITVFVLMVIVGISVMLKEKTNPTNQLIGMNPFVPLAVALILSGFAVYWLVYIPNKEGVEENE